MQEEELTPHHIKKKKQSIKANQNQTENCLFPITDSATTGFVLFYAIQWTDVASSIYLSKISIQKVQKQVTSNS